MTPFEEFTVRLMQTYWGHGCCDIDGAEIQDLAISTGIAYSDLLTQEDIDGNAAMQATGMEPDDLWTFATPELLALMKELK